ncbi:hypothetical protein Pla175_13800 [Pirellulimonas nuda]|uniref:Uncharacterized protein n=1 Tax=Pirellulimonas nuda TaxID=2528009 RepID=A0A518D963_9BACT|nr:hypothetical protein [Pirellulimonas nuda]QDU88011.1 hypothetical protein Pla175_13800 [Pirellulimonas nuda]
MRFFESAIVLGLSLVASFATSQVIMNQASTAAEGYQRGVAGVIQAQGERNLSNSQAAINMTDARSAHIDNQVKSVNAFWETRGIYEQHKQEEQYQMTQRRSAYLARNGLQSLTPQEFDRSTGAIAWPKILEQPAYDEYRKKLDELFKDRASNGALTGSQYMEATTATKEWRAAITAQKDQYPGPILSDMLRFILKVNRELDDNLS